MAALEAKMALEATMSLESMMALESIMGHLTSDSGMLDAALASFTL